MKLRREQKAFTGQISSGLPYESFGAAMDAPDVVTDNLESLRPMIQDITDMAAMPGWTKYIEPFLVKKQNPANLIKLIKEGKDATSEAASMEAFGALLNLVRSMTRTKESMCRLAVAKAAAEVAAKEAGAE